MVRQLNDIHHIYMMLGQFATISIQIVAINLITTQEYALCAQLDNQQNQDYPQTINVLPNKTADLTSLIKETLSINNKTVTNPDNSILIKDDWTFDMVEYDLMEFLQDLNARYRLNNITHESVDEAILNEGHQYESNLEGRFETIGIPRVKTDQNSTIPTISPPLHQPPSTIRSASTNFYPTSIPEPLSTSLASGDHEIGESSWQYGIFDRFTRPKSISTSTTQEPQYVSDSSEKLVVRNFNSDECGLRRYEDQVRDYYPQQFEAPEAVIELKQRRQKLPNSSTLDHKKYQQFESVLDFDRADQEENKKQISSSWASSNGKESEAYDSFKHNTEPNYENHSPSSDSLSDGEFNLSSRRRWLQQQLGNTLQLLGFNASNLSLNEFLNQTSGLSLNMRENMMKKSSKSFNFGESDHVIPEHELIARQDELKLEARVIGGSDARLGDSPWSVSLQALVSRPGTGAVEYRHYCGGTIISEYYILTAAHCLDFMVGRESRLFVVIGDLNWRMNAASLYGRRFGIEKLIIHSGYKSTAFGHDIGLIKTKESMKPLKVNGKYIVNSVCLPEKGVEHTGEAELVGWGLFSNRNEMADSLQIADVPILPRPLCVDLYRRRTGLIQWLIGVELITEKQVCAGTFGRGICQGDSGSALVSNEKVSKRVARQTNKKIRFSLSDREQQARATMIGIVAFGGIRRCSYQSLPGVYMQTSKYMDWILPRIQS